MCLLMIKNEDHPDAKYFEDIQLTTVKKEEDDPSPTIVESVDNLKMRNIRIQMKLLRDDPRGQR